MWCCWEWTWGKTWELGEQIGDIIGSLVGILGIKQPTKIQTPPSPKEEIRSSWMHVELSHLLSEISIPKFAWFQPRLLLLRKSLGSYPCFHSIQWHELDIVTYIFISTFFFKVYSSIMVLRKFVCFFVSSCWDLQNHNTPWCNLIIEKLSMRGVHWGGFIMFWLKLQELCNIEQFCCWEINKIIFIFFGKLGHGLDIVQKTLTSRVLWRWYCNF